MTTSSSLSGFFSSNVRRRRQVLAPILFSYIGGHVKISAYLRAVERSERVAGAGQAKIGKMPNFQQVTE